MRQGRAAMPAADLLCELGATDHAKDGLGGQIDTARGAAIEGHHLVPAPVTEA